MSLRFLKEIGKINCWQLTCTRDSVKIFNKHLLQENISVNFISNRNFNILNKQPVIKIDVVDKKFMNGSWKIISRSRYDKKSSKDTIDSDDESDDEEKDKNLIKMKLQSLRIDILIKSGLNIARNKVETAFFEDKIRLNGKKITKKSAHVS